MYMLYMMVISIDILQPTFFSSFYITFFSPIAFYFHFPFVVLTLSGRGVPNKFHVKFHDSYQDKGFQHGFWLAGVCAARQSDARFKKSVLINMDFNMEIT